MPTPSMPEMGNLNSFKEVTNQLIEIQDYIQWLLKNLNHLNVKQLYTEYCKIQSAAGETVINGPTILQYDKQATPKLRLKQGYDSTTGDFVYNMYNKSGVQTIGLDSSTGNAVYSGSVIIGTGNNVFGADGTNGIWLGNAAFGLAPFSVSLAGALTATNATITGAISGSTITGSTITGGTLQTAVSGNARIVITGNALNVYNATNQKMGMATGQGWGGNYGDVAFFDADVEVMRIENQLSFGGFIIKPMGTASLGIGVSGSTTRLHGNVQQVNNIGFFNGTPVTKTTVTNLSAATAGATYGANEQSMLQNSYNTLISLISALKTYNLV